MARRRADSPAARSAIASNVLALREEFRGTAGFRALPATTPGRPVALGGLAGSAKALLAAALRESSPRCLLVCCADDIEVEEWMEDLALFSPSGPQRPAARVLPELDRDEDLRPIGASLRARTALLSAVEDREVVIAEMSALMAPVAPAVGGSRKIALEVGARCDPGRLLDELRAAGLRRVPQVLARGEITLRGDVLDVWAEGDERPLRIELFDDEIESLRPFDPLDQSSTGLVDQHTLVLPAASSNDELVDDDLPFPLDLLDPARTLLLVVEPVRFEERLSRFTLRQGTLARPVAAFQDGLRRFPAYSLSTLPVAGGADLGIQPLAAVPVESWDLKGRIVAASRLKERPIVVLRSQPEVDRLLRLARETTHGRDAGIDATTGHLARGFRLPALGRCILNHGEFFGTGVARRRVVGRRQRAPIPSRALESFFELQPGDLVVHAVHGIARFIGTERTSRGVAGGEEDHLRLCFAEDVEVLVPVSKIDLVQKYVGAGEAQPKLDRLGSKAFSRRKAQVAQALRDTAADLLEIQVHRRQSPGFACAMEDPLYDEFERAFPFEDTPDQRRATKEILEDLCATRPMDRLLCGDVGFGKTELAMRAAFRVVSAGRQVATLVPTTLLADQHGRTFRDRFASFPVRCEILTRFQTPRQKREILDAVAEKRVDILIGTHRLLGDDLRFQDLGLLIIDEEQRFGVAHKERLRRLRAHIDVLTLTATPIPRTLHMSLLGIKDISSLATPPPGRLEIETQVVHRQASIIRDAILREITRGGQVFFLYNRVYDIDVRLRELQGLVPEARFVVGHGQMRERELLRSMRQFLAGEADVLVSTTIVESGLDIPRANTILVDNAHAFGLADLHQLRGRVGRDLQKAHCYLLVDPAHPITDEARKRLQAMEKFAGLGAGFSIAMRDLEIRGAGNLLGPEQSGHIAAVGYDMYCKLLQAAVERTTHPERTEWPPELAVASDVDVDIGVEAWLPEGLLEDPRMRMAVLREMDTATDAGRFAAVRASLTDRCGRLPRQAENLLSLFLVKHLLASRGMHAARFVPPDQLVLTHDAGRGPQGRWLDAFTDVRPIAPDRTCLVLPRHRKEPEAVLTFLRDALLGQQDGHKLKRRGRSRSRSRR